MKINFQGILISIILTVSFVSSVWGGHVEDLAKNVSQEIKNNVPQAEKPIFFKTTMSGDQSRAQAFISKFQNILVTTYALTILDEKSVEKSMKETALTGLTSNDVMELAGAMGARTLLLCNYKASLSNDNVEIKILDIETGKILSALSHRIPLAEEAPGKVSDGNIDIQLRKLSDAIVTSLQQAQVDIRYQRFAVLPFEEIGEAAKEHQLGLLVAAELTTNLSKDYGLFLVERQQIQKVLQEISLGQTGLLNEKTTAKAGELLGAQALVSGSVAHQGDRYQVNAKIVSTSTGGILAAHQVVLPAADLVALSSQAVVLRSKAGAVYRSLLLPGWGQMYNRQKVKGAIFIGAELVAAGLATTFHILHNDYSNQYNELTPDSPDFEQQLIDLPKKGDQMGSYRNWMLVALIAVHGFNIIDALINGVSYDSATSIRQSQAGNVAFAFTF